MSTSSQGPHSRSPTPDIPLQPDHFYGNDTIRLPPSPNSDGRDWLDPADDPTAQRGIPVFKPSLEEFQDFEGYMNRVEAWGMRSGIVKIIPPKEWNERLPSVVPQLDNIKLKHPIEQHMIGQEGRYQQQNIEKRRIMSVREWAELCGTDDLRAPGVNEIGLYARANNAGARRTRRGRKAANATVSENADATMSETAEPQQIKRELEDEPIPPEPHHAPSALISPPNSNRHLTPLDNDEAAVEALVGFDRDPVPPEPSSSGRHPLAQEEEEDADDEGPKPCNEDEEMDVKPKRRRRGPQTREAKEADLSARAGKDRDFLDSFDPHKAWLPPDTQPSSYTTEFCKDLERRYWRNCGFGKSPWYGADMQGSLFTDETTAWNVSCLPSALTRLLPASSKGLPGVNTPYLYFGMWRATFAWHVEDMDLFSINYIHFGAPKFWYAMPQARANALEQTMKGLFPGAGKNCNQFLRHKSYLASPTVLAKTSCRPNCLVQQSGEFVITFPRGYHAGFNLGFNCAESVNFALESWIDIGKKAKACACVNFSVRIDVDQLLLDRAAENREVYRHRRKERAIKNEPDLEPEPGPSKRTRDKDAKPRASRKRKPDDDTSSTKTKKQRTKPSTSQPTASSSTSPIKQIKRVMLKVGPPPPPKEQEFPCCLCASNDKQGLLRVHDPPAWWFDEDNSDAKLGPCMAHEECAVVVPETWVDEIERAGEAGSAGGENAQRTEKVVFGVDVVAKDRWNLKCTACTKLKNRAYGAKIQCTSPRCPKAFHVSCARDGHANGVVYRVLREVEKEVILLDNQPPRRQPTPPPPPPGPGILILHPDHQPRASVPRGASDLAAGDQPMDVDPAAAWQASCAQNGDPPEPQVLKTIRKTEVELLCHQHNPATLAKKKEANEKRIRDRVMSIAEGSLVKLRITNGIFEVQLLRIIEERKTVEVMWDADKDQRKEFSWKSVLVGNTDGIVAQKPSDLPPKPSPTPRSMASTARYSTPAYRPLSAAPADASSSSTYPAPSPASAQAYGSYYQQHRTGTYSYGSWPYPYSASSQPTYASASGQPSSSYGGTSYPRHHYNQYSYSSAAGHSHYPHYPTYSYNGYAASSGAQYTPQAQPQSAQADAQQKALYWQNPYTGPKEHGPKALPLTVPVLPGSFVNGYTVPRPEANAPGEHGLAERPTPDGVRQAAPESPFMSSLTPEAPALPPAPAPAPSAPELPSAPAGPSQVTVAVGGPS